MEEAGSGNAGSDQHLKTEGDPISLPDDFHAVPHPPDRDSRGDAGGDLRGGVAAAASDDRDSDMERRSWGKSAEDSPGATEESSGSVSSSYSGKLSDDQEMSKNSSPNCGRSPEVSSSTACYEDQDVERALREKLASALSSIRAKEDLVKQHAKVAEEAVSGWEKAENEVTNMKQKLENTMQKNSFLEDKIDQLDGALKECVRQLRLAREEQEQRIQDAILNKVREWETEKFELESQVVELESKLESAKTDLSASVNEDLIFHLERLEKENSELRNDIYVLAEKLRILMVESELSNQAAEAASKQHLESIKKVAKLEAECRRLRAGTRKSQSFNEQRSNTGFYVESLTDSQSDSGERMLSLDNEPSCSDSWASALVAELDQFKSGKFIGKSISPSPAEVDLMGDFLEMERLAAIPVPDQTRHAVDVRSTSEQGLLENCTLNEELGHMLQRITELEQKLEMIETEKAYTVNLLEETREKLEISTKKMKEDEIKLLEHQKQLDSFRASKQVSDIAFEAASARRKVLEADLAVAETEIHHLHEKVSKLEKELDKERSAAEKFAVNCQKLEIELDRVNRKTNLSRASNSLKDLKVKQEKHLASAAGKLSECQQTIASLGLQLKSLVTVDELILDNGNMERGNGGLPISTCESDESTLKNYPGATIHPIDPSNGRGGLSPSHSQPSSSLVNPLRPPSQVSSSRHAPNWVKGKKKHLGSA